MGWEQGWGSCLWHCSLESQQEALWELSFWFCRSLALLWWALTEVHWERVSCLCKSRDNHPQKVCWERVGNLCKTGDNHPQKVCWTTKWHLKSGAEQELCWLAGTDIHVELFHPTKNTVVTCAPVEGNIHSLIAANVQGSREKGRLLACW